MIVLKIGGSLFDSAPHLLENVKSAGVDLLVVPGGGAFADLVRTIYHEKAISDDAAHWMAVLAMDEYAYYLSDKTGIKLTDSLARMKGVSIALPYEILRKHDELPHSWDVTSDTIAAWMARKTGSRFIKATDVDGVIMDGRLQERIAASKLEGTETCVDKALPGYLIRHEMNAFVVNGLMPSRVEAAVKEKPAIGTLIMGKQR